MLPLLAKFPHFSFIGVCTRIFMRLGLSIWVLALRLRSSWHLRQYLVGLFVSLFLHRNFPPLSSLISLFLRAECTIRLDNFATQHYLPPLYSLISLFLRVGCTIRLDNFVLQQVLHHCFPPLSSLILLFWKAGCMTQLGNVVLQVLQSYTF